MSSKIHVWSLRVCINKFGNQSLFHKIFQAGRISDFLEGGGGGQIFKKVIDNFVDLFFLRQNFEKTGQKRRF